MSTTSSEIIHQLRRTTDRIVGEEDLENLLRSGRPLRIKYGVDCTAPHLHLGHGVNLWMMRHLQEHGHRVVFLLGDMTTRIGDPTGKSETRPALTPEVIETNAEAFLAQISTVLLTDPEVFEVRRNSEWFGAMEIGTLLGLFSMVTHAQLIAREMFRQRLARGQEIALHEFLYPVLQGYDSVAVRSDVTVVGSDQLFNEMMGRHFQQRLGLDPQVVITSTITPGLDGGPKQSKSLNNYVALTDTPEDKFGKLMTLPDELIAEFARIYTDLPLSTVEDLGDAARAGGTPARDAKQQLAESVVSRYHGTESASRIRREFTEVFSQRSVPKDIPDLVIEHATPTVLDLLARKHPEASNSERRRLIAQKGVSIDGRTLTDPEERIQIVDGAVVKSGKRIWHRLRILR